MLADGSVFTATQLPLNKPILLIYFSPGCDHCEKLLGSFVKNKNTFNNTSVVMITYYPVSTLKDFKNQFGLYKYNNIYVGTEGNTFFVKQYYDLKTLPFMALFTEKGDLVQKYYSENDMDKLIKHLKK